MSDSSRAVFLSYASQDSEAATRICDTLRAAGIEVWFDQSELRGGDAWDQKIRKQIKECALFVPVISANTQARGEGYFRLEWKLAVDRSHLMARDQPFLVPVTVDGTSGVTARVPEEFHAVQWTRLAGDEALTAFVDRMQGLLGREVAPVSDRRITGSETIFAGQRPALRRQSRAVWISAAAVAAAGAIGFGLFRSKPEVAGGLPETKPAEPVMTNAADKSIAVLPFENRSDDTANAYFTDGVHDDILTTLGNIRELRVISRTSVQQYRGTTKNIPQIAKELGVAFVLEGSVQRVGNKVHVTGQLIDARSDTHLWAKAYDKDLTDVFAIQAALAQEIAAALSAALSPQEKKIIEHRPTANAAAYDLYLAARNNASQLTSGARLADMEQLLQRAVALDANFAEAWGALAEVEASYVNGGWDTTSERLTKADAAIGRAVRLAPDSPEVIRSIGNYALNAYGDYDRAYQQFAKLAVLMPNDATVRNALAWAEWGQRKWSQAAAGMRRAVELDPANGAFSSDLRNTLMKARRWDEVIEELKRQLKLKPDTLRLQFELADVYFKARGETVPAQNFFAKLTPSQAQSPDMILARKVWDFETGALDHYLELDRVMPYHPDVAAIDGTPIQSAYAITSGITYLAKHDRAGAVARLKEIMNQLRDKVASEPENGPAWSDVSMIEALIGDHNEALRCGRRAIELRPNNEVWVLNFAIAKAWIGEKDSALADLAHLLQVPNQNIFSQGVLNIYQLRASPLFMPLKDDPRFEALLNDPKNNAPLF